MLAAFVEDRLPVAERAAVEDHIDVCDSCRYLLGAVTSAGVASAARSADRVSFSELLPSLPWQPPPQIDEYRIVRPIGQGQMGQVFEAHDQELDRRVALKVLGQSKPNDASRDRFRTEARAVARLKHIGVVAVYRTGVVEDRPYIVSELIDGRSLDRVEKPLQWRESIRIGLCIARALAAAHSAGVLHRDIKPANIMLTKDGEARLLDFGLAKLAGTLPVVAPVSVMSADPMHDAASITRTGTLVGTPRYMAPEVWRGESATEKTDLYSLGGVLYELCAGHAPFVEEDLPSLHHAVLNRDPAPLAQVAASVPPSLAALVMSCLCRAPADRPPDAQSVALRLEQILADADESRRRRARRWTVLIAVALMAGVVSGAVWLGLGRNKPQLPVASRSLASATGPRQSVAIIGFHNQTGRLENSWISTALSELMRTMLTTGNGLRVIPGDQVFQMKNDLGFSENEQPTRQTLHKIRNYYLSVDLLLSGSYSLRGDTVGAGLRFEYRLQNITSGETLAEGAASSKDGSLFSLAVSSGENVRKQLGLDEPQADVQSALRVQLPDTPEAAQAYAEGLAASQSWDYLRARDRLEYAVRLAPQNPNVHQALATVYFNLGHQDKQRESARKAFSMSGRMDIESQLRIEVTYNVSIRNMSHAIEIQKKLFSEFPDSLDYGLELASMQGSADMPQDSIETIRLLEDRFPSAKQNDPRIDLISEFPYRNTSNFATALQVARRAATKAAARGSPHLVAKALISEGWTLYRSGEFEKAEQILDKARIQLKAKNTSNDVAWANLGSANAKSRLGKLSQAIEILNEQISLMKIIGSTDNLFHALLYSAAVELNFGMPESGLIKLDEARNIARNQTDKTYTFVVELQLAENQLALGKQAQAFLAIAAARAALNPPQDPRGNGMLLLVEGRGRYLAGELAVARKLLTDAIVKLSTGTDAYRAAQARMVLAELFLGEGTPAIAEKHAREAAISLAQHNSRDLHLQSRAVLAQALLSEGRKLEAAREMAQIRESAAVSENARTRLRVALADAQVRAASAKKADVLEARLDMEAAKIQAERIGYVPERFMISLILAQITSQLGERELARKQLQALVTEAQALGMGLYEKKAQSLLAR